MWHYEDLYNFLEEKKDDAVCLVIADVHNVTGEPYAILHWVQKMDGGAYRGVRKLVKLAWENNIPVYQNGIGRLRQ